MSRDITPDRRSVLKTGGALAAGAAAGGAGLWAFTGGAAAGHTSLTDASAQAVSTDDGEIEFVAYGGVLKYQWDGLDTPAQWGEYVTEARLIDNTGSQLVGWRALGSDSGELGASWGGDNDHTQDTGTEGYFQFNYGHAFGQGDYAVAYTDAVAKNPGDYGPEGLRLVDADNDTDGYQSPFDTSHFNVSDDGSTQTTYLEVRHTCRVYDGEPGSGGSVVGVPDEASGRVPVEVTNEAASGHTGGRMDGSAGGDET